MNRPLVPLLAIAACLCTGCNQQEVRMLQAQLAQAQAQSASLQKQLAEANAELDAAQQQLADQKAQADAAWADREIEVDLPEASEARPLNENPTLVIDVQPDGKLTGPEGAMTRPELESLLEEIPESDSPSHVLIRANHRTKMNALLPIMDLCNRHGVQHSVEVLQEEAAEEPE